LQAIKGSTHTKLMFRE